MTIPPSIYGTIPYGLYKYGSTGTQDAPIFRWALEVDWDGDGVFDGSNEAGRMTDIDITRGRKTLLQPNGQGFYPIQPGNAKITLDNYDGRYDAWNSSSPLYPNVVPGRDVRLKAFDPTTYPAAGSTYDVFYGIISDLIPIGYGSTALVKMVVDDTLSYLRNVSPETDKSTSITVNTAISTILTESGWLSRWGTNLSTSSFTIPYFWCVQDMTAADQAGNVANSFLGMFFVDGSGQAVYKDRIDSSTDTKDYTEPIFKKDISLPQPWVSYRNVSKINHVLIETDPFGYSVIETNTGGVNIQPNTTYKINFDNQSRFDLNAYPGVEPYVGFQRKVSFPFSTSAAEVLLYPSSTSTSQLSTSFWTTYDLTNTVYGFQAILNHSNTSTTVVARPQLYSYLVDITNNSVYYPTSTSTDNRFFNLNTTWIQDSVLANTTVSIVGAFLSQNNKFPIIQVTNRPSYQFPELFDKVNLDVPTLGITTESFRVGGIEHIGTPQDIRTTIYLESYIST